MIAAGLTLWFSFTSTLLPKLKEALGQPELPTTQNGMKQIGLVFKMYANESKGNRWPTLAPDDRIWAPDLSVLYPEYLTDPSVLVAREHPDAKHILASLHAVLAGPNPDCDTAAGLMALSFAYLGHAVRDEAGFGTLVEARNLGILEEPGGTKVLPDGKGSVLPLQMGIDLFFFTDVNGPAAPPSVADSIPVLVETWPWKHKAPEREFSGCHVLYFDGHVERVPLGVFPVVPAVMDALCGLAP